MKTIRLLLATALASLASITHAATPATKATSDAAGTVSAASLKLEGTGFYLDQGKWAAINHNERKEASVKFVAPARNGAYHIRLEFVNARQLVKGDQVKV
ncbi:MAG: hypothetical protein NTU75_04475, partial [Sphingomonadales bacterium]|nr:hypothetical protein [Sphingomonadales bacterium]